MGFSDTPAWVVARAVAIADLRGWIQPSAIQLPYNLADRSPERELLPMANELGLAVAVWGVLEEGVLTGKYSRKPDEPRRNPSAAPRPMAIGDAVMKVAEEIGRSPAQVAINWVRQQRGTIVPILGTRSETQMKDDLGCLDFELAPEHLDRLSEASPIELGFPRSFLESDHVRGLIFGETFDLIDHS